MEEKAASQKGIVRFNPSDSEIHTLYSPIFTTIPSIAKVAIKLLST